MITSNLKNKIIVTVKENINKTRLVGNNIVYLKIKLY